MKQDEFDRFYDDRVKKNNKFIDEYNKGSRIMFGIAFVLLFILLSLFGCSTNDDLDDCGCTKTTYTRLVINNHLTTQIQSVENIDCQDEGSQDIDNTHYYTIRCD